jgi:hypothetical protein
MAAVASSLAVVAVPPAVGAWTRREWGREALHGRKKKKEKKGGSGDEAAPFITTQQGA